MSGASRGIGLEFVRQLLRREDVGRVLACCRDPADAAGLQALREAHPARLGALTMDVTDETSIARAADQAGGQVEALGLLVNCAGFLHGDGRMPEKRVEDASPDYLAHSFAINASSVLLIAKHFHRLFPRTGRCVFASLSARVGSIGDNRLGGWYGYRAAKAAQNQITRTLSIELQRKHRGIICVALHPGTTDTDLSRPFQRNVSEEQLFPVSRSVGHLLDVVDGLGVEDNGRFFAWDGKPIPW